MEKRNLRIAFTGPESTGKTSLSRWLAETYSLPYIEEFARSYLSDNPSYSQKDLDVMAEGQFSLWPTSGCVADTEMHVFEIWSTFKYKKVSNVIVSLLEKQRFDHYFLCAPDIPWQADPLRENPLNRDLLFDLYLKALREKNRSFSVVRGNMKERHEQIQAKVLNLLNT